MINQQPRKNKCVRLVAFGRTQYSISTAHDITGWKTRLLKKRNVDINAQFIFKPNGLFFLKLPANAPTEFRELESMNNKMWHIKSKERMVFVGSLDEDLMMINVKITNGFYYFLIEDTPLVLKMKRSR